MWMVIPMAPTNCVSVTTQIMDEITILANTLCPSVRIFLNELQDDFSGKTMREYLKNVTCKENMHNQRHRLDSFNRVDQKRCESTYLLRTKPEKQHSISST
jgi:hypothetical protein